MECHGFNKFKILSKSLKKRVGIILTFPHIRRKTYVMGQKIEVVVFMDFDVL